jgi:hypothetical protein
MFTILRRDASNTRRKTRDLNKHEKMRQSLAPMAGCQAKPTERKTPLQVRHHKNKRSSKKAK